MDYRERGSHERGVHPTQDTSRMGTARVKEEEKANIRVIVILLSLLLLYTSLKGL